MGWPAEPALGSWVNQLEVSRRSQSDGSLIYSTQPNWLLALRGRVRGVACIGCQDDETRLVPFLHNGRLPKTGAVCPPEIQLVLVTKGIMDVQFLNGD